MAENTKNVNKNLSEKDARVNIELFAAGMTCV
jgi:hypothetical protein